MYDFARRNIGCEPTVELLDILRFVPILSAGGWFLLAFLQVYRDRWHTWTETFFLFACFFAGLYAVGDWLFFNVPPGSPGSASEASALLAARLSMSSLVLTETFFLLFTEVYVDRMRRWYWLANAASIGILGMVWIPNALVTGVRAGQFDRIYLPVFNEYAFGIVLIYVLICSLVGVYNLIRLYRIVRTSSRLLARRAAGLVAVFTAVLVVGLGTNGLLGIVGNRIGNQEVPPPFSTLLVFLAGATYYVLYPVGRERISEAIRRFQARRYTIKAVFLTYEDGTLIGSKTRSGETSIDQDLFGATLDVIQNFMRTSFPMLRGKWLSSISQGPYILVMERARHTYVTVVLEGQESDQLRRQMRDLLLSFEDRNREVLSRWQGIPSQAQGTDEMLSQFFVEVPFS